LEPPPERFAANGSARKVSSESPRRASATAISIAINRLSICRARANTKLLAAGSAAYEFHLAAKRSHFSCSSGIDGALARGTRQRSGRHNRPLVYAVDRCARKREGRMALSLRDVRRDPVANRALEELMHHYTVAEEKSHLVLTKKAGNMKLFLNDLDDLHQWDFIHNQKMVKEIERLRVLLATIEQQRESWKVRALMAEAQLLEATAKTSNNSRCQNVSDVRYASLKRFLAKQFHPDYAPGQGIEKIVRNEIFKEIWNEIERLDQGVPATRFATARSASAA
jgi:hypothetical protein